MSNFFRSRGEDPIILASEWTNTVAPTPVTRPPGERGRRPRPITAPEETYPLYPSPTPWADPVSMTFVTLTTLPPAAYARFLSQTAFVVVVGVSFISRFRLWPLMGMRQERPGLYLRWYLVCPEIKVKRNN
jgi:hypothetical protein